VIDPQEGFAMNSNTHTYQLSAPKCRVFEFLSKIENLPKWATMFCKELKRVEGNRYKVVTPQGEIFFRIDADAKTGVIDMFGGPTEERMAYWPARVVERGGGSLFIFTAYQYPGISDSEFAKQCEGLRQEFPSIAAHTS
jgi:hypothetical protein